jgi:hypothetical protein
MNLSRLQLAMWTFLVVLSSPGFQAQAQSALAVHSFSHQEMSNWNALAKNLENQHPAEYYKSAKNLFLSGRRDEATFIFYLGQLRYRIYLVANPSLPQDGDPALFSALSEAVGRPINEYAFGDIPVLERTIQAVLVYDEAYPDRFTPSGKAPKQRQTIREGFERMRAKILTDADLIRAGRLKNGLQNRD